MATPIPTAQTITALNLEAIAALSDTDLVLLAQIGRLDRDQAIAQCIRIDGEITRRIRNRGAEVLTTPMGRATLKQLTEYKWNTEKAREVLAPLATPEEMKKAFRPKAVPPPPPPAIVVHSQSAKAIAKKNGPDAEAALEECYELVPKGPPKLEIALYGEPLPVETDPEDDEEVLL